VKRSDIFVIILITLNKKLYDWLYIYFENKKVVSNIKNTKIKESKTTNRFSFPLFSPEFWFSFIWHGHLGFTHSRMQQVGPRHQLPLTVGSPQSFLLDPFHMDDALLSKILNMKNKTKN